MLVSKLKERIIKLRQKKYRIEYGEFIIEGLKGVSEAISSKNSISAVVLEDTYAKKPDVQDLLKKLNDSGVEINIAKKQEVEKIKTTETFPGIMAVVKMPDYSLSDLLKENPLIILDGINDPGNLGTIIRTTDWFGIKGLLLSEDCVDAYNEKVTRSSMGSIFRAKIVEAKDIVKSVEQIKKNGYDVVSLAMSGEDVNKLKPATKTAYIFGSESHGIRPELLKLADKTYTIKGKGKAESLNVGVAAGILMSKL